MRKRQTFTWNVAFQPSLTETEQVEELMGFKEDRERERERERTRSGGNRLIVAVVDDVT